MRTDVRLSPSRLGLEQILDRLERDDTFDDAICRWERLPARPPRYANHPDWLDQRLVTALASRGIAQLYTHQRPALESIHTRRSGVLVTPTASRKTLCYDPPVLDALPKEPNAPAPH